MLGRYLSILVISMLLFSACKTTTASKIPFISLIAFVPDSMKVNIDTTYLYFNIVDGDADIGNSDASQIYLKDSRFDSLGFIPTPFPTIDKSIEDPAKGLEGTCVFFPFPQPTPRLDSNHFNTGDTLHYEFYITDRAGHQSNHITTHDLIIRP